MTVIERMERHEAKGRLIRQIREDHGYSQQFVANAIGVARSTIQKVEAGEAGTNDDRFWDFLELMGMTEAEFAHMLEDGTERTESELERHINAELRAVLSSMSLHIKLILHYVFCRKWGGDVESLMDLMACHISLTLMQRLRHSEMYVSEYRLNKELGILQNDQIEPPNVEQLDITNKVQAREALLNGQERY